jgi:uncharacterized protein (TIGR00369 family)
VTPTELQALLGQIFAPWLQQLELQVQACTPGEVRLWLPVHPRHVHGGGVLCGQTLMAAADTAMVLAVSHQLGGFQPMTTVQLQTSFLRPVPAAVAGVQLLARVLKPGRRLVFGEIQALLPDDQLAMHATTTYALL